MVLCPSGFWRGDPSVLDAFESAVFVVDAVGLVEFANAAAHRLFETPDDPLVGAALGRRMFAPAEQSAVAEVMAEGWSGVPWRGRLSVLEGGAQRGAEVACWPLREGDAVTGLLVTLECNGGDSESQLQARRLADRLARLARATSELVMATPWKRSPRLSSHIPPRLSAPPSRA